MFLDKLDNVFCREDELKEGYEENQDDVMEKEVSALN